MRAAERRLRHVFEGGADRAKRFGGINPSCVTCVRLPTMVGNKKRTPRERAVDNSFAEEEAETRLGAGGSRDAPRSGRAIELDHMTESGHGGQRQ